MMINFTMYAIARYSIFEGLEYPLFKKIHAPSFNRTIVTSLRRSITQRGMKVMLDRDLADLYGVKAIRLREQVKRNIDRFPGNFMFRLTEEEADYLVSQNAIPDKKRLGGHLPYVFTEHGLLMLANVLKSGSAIKVSIRIIEIFIQIREMMLNHKEIFLKMERIEHLVLDHEDKIRFIFDYLKQLELVRKQEKEQSERRRIGFRPGHE